jgi:hypothetical protein
MHRGGYLPRRDAEFLPWAENIKAQCAANAAWQIANDDMVELSALCDAARSAYDANNNPQTANRQTSLEKRMSFERLKRFLSTFITALEVNKRVSDEAIQAMGLRPRAHHAHLPLPRPTEAPDITAVHGEHCSVTVYAGASQKGHPSAYSGKGYHGIRVRYRVEDQTEWKERMESRLHATLLFDESDQAKRVTITAAWLNPRLEAGPESEAVTVVIA